MSPLDEYTLLSIIVESLVVVGGIFTVLVFSILNKYLKQKRLWALQIAGFIMLSIGVITVRVTGVIFSKPSQALLLMIVPLTGGILVVLPFLATKKVKFKGELVLQLILIVSSISLTSRFSDITTQLIYVGILLALLVLVHSLLTLRILSPFLRYSLLLSSWLFVAYSWLRYLINKASLGEVSFLIVLLYSSAVILWVYSAMGVYDYLRRWL